MPCDGGVGCAHTTAAARVARRVENVVVLIDVVTRAKLELEIFNLNFNRRPAPTAAKPFPGHISLRFLVLWKPEVGVLTDENYG